VFFTPRWIASHLFAATMVIAFVGAGLWQIERLGERQDENDLVVSRMGSAESYEVLLVADSQELEFRRVVVQGSFDPTAEILIANRSDEGTPGFWLWTNFVTASGDDVLVNRGFVPRAVILETAGAQSLANTRPTAGLVTIEGLLRRGLDGGRVATNGDQLSRPDATQAVEILGLDPSLDPSLYIDLDAQDPPRTSSTPRPVPAPDLGEGPHLSYAFQWFTFALIGAIGYAAILLRIRRGDQARGDVPHDVEASA
jgi:cytochrome oxidase assembly protein ShyY1